MQKAGLLFALTLLLCSGKSHAQKGDIIDVLTALGGKMNVHLPIADSLPPFAIKEIADLHKKFGLSRREVAEIKHASNTGRGFKLDTSFLPGGRLISSNTLYKAYQTGDSLSLSFIEKNKPFYSLSVPIFFSDSKKAVIDMDLIGSGGYTYL